MNAFEFFMAFYGLMLGLSLAELMSSFGDLHRLREKPQWGLFSPLAGGCVFLTIVASFSDAWTNLKDVAINLRSLSAPIAVAMCLYLSSIMVLPRDADGWPSLDEYFLARRRSILLPLAASIQITIFTFELPRMILRHVPLSFAYIFINVTTTTLLCIAALVRSRWIIMISLSLYLGVIFTIYFTGLSITQLFDQFV